jgi:DNA-binding response OmpR family regulator
MSVLIVEDNEGISSALEMILNLEGAQTDIAASGDAALELIRQKSYEAVILDLNIGGVPSAEVARALHSLRTADGRGPKIIVVSAAANIESEAARIGADKFVKKPFDPDELVRTLGDFCFFNDLSRASALDKRQ